MTTEEDLEIIFSRFGKITSCDIIRDYKTGAAAALLTLMPFLLKKRQSQQVQRLHFAVICVTHCNCCCPSGGRGCTNTCSIRCRLHTCFLIFRSIETCVPFF